MELKTSFRGKPQKLKKMKINMTTKLNDSTVSDVRNPYTHSFL